MAYTYMYIDVQPLNCSSLHFPAVQIYVPGGVASSYFDGKVMIMCDACEKWYHFKLWVSRTPPHQRLGNVVTVQIAMWFEYNMPVCGFTVTFYTY